MLLVVLAVVAVGIWFTSELTDARKVVRVFAGVFSIAIASISSWAICSTISLFDKTMEINTVTKNLARGLVQITQDPLDVDKLRENLSKLNTDIAPTYHHHGNSRDAVSDFLIEYGIEYETEISIEDPNVNVGTKK